MQTTHRELPEPIRSSVAELGTRQSGVVRRDQLAAVGLSPHVIEAELRAKRWQALNAPVLVMHNGPLTLVQQWTAVVLSAEGPACLAARTAAQAGGLVGWECEPIHILVVRGAKTNPVPGVQVKVHESRRFTAEDIHPHRTPPQVRLERAVVDAAVWSSSPRTACGLMAAAVQQRLTTADRLRDELDGAGHVRHRKLLGSVLNDIEGGAQAVSELDFLRFCRRHRLPRPVLQVRCDSRGRRRYLDATFKRRDGKLIGVEVDGAIHLVVSTYWKDMARLNDLVIGGRRILRLPSSAVYADDPVAVAQLRTALQLPDLSERHPPIAG